MTTRKATLIIRYKAAVGWKRAEAARGANGRIRPGYALLNGEPVKCDEYTYQVRFYDARKLHYLPAGNDANKAETLRRRTEQQESVKAEAAKAGVRVHVETERKTLADSAADYVRDAEQRNANEAAMQARNVTAEFMRLTSHTHVDEIDRGDVYGFHAALRKRGCEDRTVANKHDRLKSWLLFAGVDRSIIPPRPKYEEQLPTVYTSDEISTILGAADPYMSTVITLALKCGLRDQELAHLEWSDVDEGEQVLRVCGKAKYHYRVKDSEQREVPLSADVVALLSAWRQTRGDSSGLIIPTATGRPNTKLLRLLKRLARQAGLNCGKCDGCNGPNRECETWTLHKFRRTYCTTLLRNEFDLRTVQAYMGHADLASTMRYLRPAATSETRAKMNNVKW